jgi:glycosyltransferase involved in cell wall biosynthesis
LDSLGLAWQINLSTGWGVFGLNLALELARCGTPNLRLICPGPIEHLRAMPPWHRRAIGALEGRRLTHAVPGLRFARDRAELKFGTTPDVILYALGNDFTRLQVRGRAQAHRAIGVVFLENSRIAPEGLARARYYDRIIAGSHWNESVLRAQGIDHATAVLQGVDIALFHPRPRAGLTRERFVVFSGGALEFRKGQDIVLAAFRAFRQRHPEALLVTCWHTPFSERIASIALGRHARGAVPARPDGTPDVAAWMARHDIPTDGFFDPGYVSYHNLPDLLAECDAAVFPSRVEGGTNLFAMQAAASGVPTIVSANTGHLDLIERAGVSALARQAPVAASHLRGGETEGWGESDPEEIVEALEAVWRRRETAQVQALAVAKHMAAWSWRTQTEELLNAIIA